MDVGDIFGTLCCSTYWKNNQVRTKLTPSQHWNFATLYKRQQRTKSVRETNEEDGPESLVI